MLNSRDKLSRRSLFNGLLEWTGAPAAQSAFQERLIGRNVRVYFIGNSVTDTVNYNGLKELAKSRGINQIWGRHMIPGSPLFLLWREKTGFTESPFGATQEALKNYAWDMITVQPFDRFLVNDNDEGDLSTIQKIVNLAVAKNPDVQIYIYSRWPRITRNGKGFAYDKNDYDPRRPGSGIPLGEVDDYHTKWMAKYTGGWDGSNETKSYFEQVLRGVRDANPKMRKPALLIPVGQTMDNLDSEMRAGRVPGYKSIYQFYRDGIHLNVYGSYMTACTFFATMYRQDPVGLPTTPYGDLDPTTARIIQKVVWHTVQSEPFAGGGGKR